VTSSADQVVEDLACYPTVSLAPLRYAIVPKAIGEKSSFLYECSNFNLDLGFNELELSAYSIRVLRPGYVYVYDESLEDKNKRLSLWEVDEEGNYVSLQWKNSKDYGKNSKRGSPKPLIDVRGDSEILYIVYSPDLWSRNGVVSNIKNRDVLMTKINVKKILAGSLDEEHVLSSDTPEKWIEEYKVKNNNYLGQFGWSSFVPERVANMSALKSPKQPVFVVLYDNIATAVDAGNIATLYMHQLYDITNKNPRSDEDDVVGECQPIPDDLMLDSSKLVSNSLEFHHKKAVSDIIDGILKSTYPDAEKKLAKKIITYQKRIQNHRDHNYRHVGQSEARINVLSNSDDNPGVESFTKHIDMIKLIEFQKLYDQEQIRIDAIVKKVLKATSDHKTVLSTMELSESNLKESRNIATTLKSYDRDSVWTAAALEQSIAFAIQGMGIPVPGNADKDERYALLKKWAEDESSPLFLGVMAFKPFKEKIDTSADLIGGIGELAGELHKKFPYALGTNIIVNEVTAYSMTKVKGETRWTKSKSVVRNVNEALEGSNLKKLFKAFQGRYNIVSKSIESTEVTKQVYRIINLSDLDKKSTSFSVSGSRTVKLTETKITTSSKMNSVSKTIGVIRSSALPAGVAWMHMINLFRASGEFSRDASLGNSLNLGSALFGFAGAFNEVAIISTRTSIAGRIIGKQVQERALAFMVKQVSLKTLGYAGAALEGAANAYETTQLAKAGDTDAAVAAGVAAVTLSAGGIMVTHALALAAGSAVVPYAGWLVTGVCLIIAGMAAIYYKVTHKDKPIDVWVSRTVFGIPLTDGGVFGGGDEVYPSYADMQQALYGYYRTIFVPVKIAKLKFVQTEENKEKLKNSLTDSAMTDWLETKNEARFLILLPGFRDGISRASYILNCYDRRNVDSLKDAANTPTLQKDVTANIHESDVFNEGKYVYFNKVFRDENSRAADSASLEIRYWPDGYSEDPVIETFFVDTVIG